MDTYAQLEGCTVITQKDMTTLLAQEAVTGKRELEPLKSFSKAQGLPMNILEDTNIATNEVEVHTEMGDLWHCLQGTATFVLGGTMFEPKNKINKDGTENTKEVRAARVDGGKEITLNEGDWLWIPPNVPHTHRAEGTARLAIIKIPKV